MWLCAHPHHTALEATLGQHTVPRHSPEYLSFCQAALRGGPPEQCAGTFSRCSVFCLSFPHFFLRPAEHRQPSHLRTREPKTRQPSPGMTRGGGGACRTEQPARGQGRVQSKALSQAPLFSSPRAGHRAASSHQPTRALA